MAEERKKYDKEFKFTVVELSLLRGKVKEVAEEWICNKKLDIKLSAF